MQRSPRKRIPSLDGLRAVAILLVLWCHAFLTYGFPDNNAWEHWLGRFGYLHGTYGVSIFFVISGYLITTLLLREREKSGRIALGNFYVRRAFRIFPAAYVYLLVITVLGWHTIATGQLLAAWLYVVDFMRHMPWNLVHLWSLGVEEQFYLLWPVALVLFWKKKEKIAIGAILAAILFRVLFVYLGIRDIINYAFPCVEDALAAGCLLAMCRDRIPTRLVDRWVLPIAFLVLLADQVSMPAWAYLLFVETARNLGTALLVDHCIRKEYRLLNWKPVVWLGAISYSLYLWQMPFLRPKALAPSAHLWIEFPYNLGLALAVACGSYYLVEQPILRLRDRIFRRPYADVLARNTVGDNTNAKPEAIEATMK